MTPSGRLTVGIYVCLAASLLVLELMARRPRSRIPTFPDLLRSGMRRRDVQLAVLLTWWWLGWHFLLNL